GPCFGVHVSSFRKGANATMEAIRFEDAGFPTVIRSLVIPNKGSYVRVYLGPYADRATAEEVARQFKATGLQEYTQVHSLPGGELSAGPGRENR
ncbi:MAG: SPOR domain-containing protein, partial [Gemmatimonadetes bacterium]|nr:SPOR domain-containing protein [Gemmatimonadota bacterium]